MVVVMRGPESAFRSFGCVPSEVQMKAVVIGDRREQGGRLVKNPEFLRSSLHWGLRIRACRPYRAQTKSPVPQCTLLCVWGDGRIGGTRAVFDALGSA